MSVTTLPLGCPLTKHQLAAVEAVARGESQKQFAASTGRTRATVRSLLGAAYGRLGVDGAPQAVVECVRHGWLGITPSGVRQLNAPDPGLDGPEGVTARQAVYLEAFEQLLRAREPDEARASAKVMDRALGQVFDEAEMTPRRDRRREAFFDRLIADMGRMGGTSEFPAPKRKRP